MRKTASYKSSQKSVNRIGHIARGKRHNPAWVVLNTFDSFYVADCESTILARLYSNFITDSVMLIGQHFLIKHLLEQFKIVKTAGLDI